MGGKSGSDGPADEARLKEKKEKAARKEGIEKVNALFGYGKRGQNNVNINRNARREAYRRVGRDVKDFFKSDLDRENLDTSRELGFELARRGQLAGSVQLDQEGELQRLRDRALIDITQRGRAARQGLRASDEQSRLTAIRDINADVDTSSVLSSAATQLGNSGKAAYTTAIGEQFGDFFRNLSYLYAAQRQNQGFNDQINRFPGSAGPSSGSQPKSNFGIVR